MRHASPFTTKIFLLLRWARGRRRQCVDRVRGASAIDCKRCCTDRLNAQPLLIRRATPAIWSLSEVKRTDQGARSSQQLIAATLSHFEHDPVKALMRSRRPRDHRSDRWDGTRRRWKLPSARSLAPCTPSLGALKGRRHRQHILFDHLVGARQ
jgi:hypothetical protein